MSYPTVNQRRQPPHDGERKSLRAYNRLHHRLAKLPSVAYLILGLLLSGCAMSGSSSDAACGQNLPNVKPSQAAPSETFRLRGGGFVEGCNDTGPPFGNDSARKDIRVEMRQGERSWTLASGLTADGPPDYTLNTKLKVPADAKPGRAVVVIPDPSNAEPPKLPFRVLGGGSG